MNSHSQLAFSFGVLLPPCRFRKLDSRVPKVGPRFEFLFWRENSLFFENLLGLEKFPVPLRREFIWKPLNQLND